MDVSSIEAFIERNPNITRRIDIREMVKDIRKVIVVDGNEFAMLYMFKSFKWVVGEITEFTEHIRDFVKAFDDLYVKLVFIFYDCEVKEYSFKEWRGYRSIYVKCATKILQQIESEESVGNLNILPENNMLRPLDVVCWTVSILRKLNCEVICLQCSRKDAVNYTVSYARTKNCLAILSQCFYYILFRPLDSLLLSMKHFDLRRMTTKVYDILQFDHCLQINPRFYPLFATFVCSEKEFGFRNNSEVAAAILKRVSPVTYRSWCHLICSYISTYYESLAVSDIPGMLIQHFSPRQSAFILKRFVEYDRMLNAQNETVHNLLTNKLMSSQWHKIIQKCHKLYESGKVCSRIISVIEKQTYVEYTTLEDFVGLPPASRVYRALREKLYGILLHEYEGFETDPVVKEWCTDGVNSPDYPVLRTPSKVFSQIHPGLLNLWDPRLTDEHQSIKKWRLFAAAISSTIAYSTLQNLSESLVMPVAVLYYLFHEMEFSNHEYALIINSWELEVFLVVAITLPVSDVNFLRQLKIKNGNARAIRLAAIFMHGCDIMKTVIQACGFVLEEPYSCIENFFDGKLFHYLHEKRLVGETILDINSELFLEFLSVKKILHL